MGRTNDLSIFSHEFWRDHLHGLGVFPNRVELFVWRHRAQHMETEAEIVVMHLQIKKRQRLLAFTKAKRETCNGFSLRVLRKNQFCWDLKFQTPAFRTVIKLISVHLSHQFVVLCYGSFGKLTQVVSTAVSESLMSLVWIILWTCEFSLAGIKLCPSSTYPTCSLKYAPIILKVICKFKFSLYACPFFITMYYKAGFPSLKYLTENTF